MIDKNRFHKKKLQEKILKNSKNPVFSFYLNSCSDSRYKMNRIQIQIIAQHFRKLIRSQQSLILIPAKCISQFLTFNVHIQSDGHQNLRQSRIFMNNHLKEKKKSQIFCKKIRKKKRKKKNA